MEAMGVVGLDNSLGGFAGGGFGGAGCEENEGLLDGTPFLGGGPFGGAAFFGGGPLGGPCIVGEPLVGTFIFGGAEGGSRGGGGFSILAFFAGRDSDNSLLESSSL